MEQEKALNVIIEGIKIAQKRGAYSLEEIDQILTAIKSIIGNNKTEPVTDTTNS